MKYFNMLRISVLIRQTKIVFILEQKFIGPDSSRSSNMTIKNKLALGSGNFISCNHH